MIRVDPPLHEFEQVVVDSLIESAEAELAFWRSVACPFGIWRSRRVAHNLHLSFKGPGVSLGIGKAFGGGCSLPSLPMRETSRTTDVLSYRVFRGRPLHWPRHRARGNPLSPSWSLHPTASRAPWRRGVARVQGLRRLLSGHRMVMILVGASSTERKYPPTCTSPCSSVDRAPDF